MKQIIPILFLLAIVFSSCKKYDEGPALSFRSKRERAINIWTFTSVSDHSGNDLTANYNNWIFSIDENNNLLIQWYLSGIKIETYGTWNFNEDKSSIELTYTNTILESQFSKSLEILRLKEKNLIVNTESFRFDFSGTL